MKLKIKEKDLQRDIIQFLTLKRIFHYRNNSGAFKREDGHFYRFGALGSPDIICVIKGRYIGIECKGTNGVQSENQIKFQQELEKAEGLYILASSLDDIINNKLFHCFV